VPPPLLSLLQIHNVQSLRHNQPPIEVATRLSLPNARDLYVAELNKLLAMGDAQAAARLAVESPQSIPSMQGMIEWFEQVQPQPISQFFPTLLETGALDKSLIESIQLVELAQGRTQLIGDAGAAARLANKSPQGTLRMQQGMIELFKHVPPMFQCFPILLETGALPFHDMGPPMGPDFMGPVMGPMVGGPGPVGMGVGTGVMSKPGSIELLELAQGRTKLIEAWLNGEKLGASEGLGDLRNPVGVPRSYLPALHPTPPHRGLFLTTLARMSGWGFRMFFACVG
jgi:hypothetical protein